MRISEMANADCEECGGEGHYDVAYRDDAITIPCQKCFPPAQGQIETSWEDLRDDDD